MGEMKTEDEIKRSPLTTSREPKGRVKPGDKGSIGGMALNDALLLLVAAWLILFLLAFSVRNYNV